MESNEQRRARYWRNRERELARQAAYYRANRRRELARRRRWYADRRADIKGRRHARRAGANGGSFTGEEWRALCREYGDRCLACGRTEGEAGPLTPDHVKPLALGGSGGIENIQPLCFSCNSAKSGREIDYRPRARAEQLLDGDVDVGDAVYPF